MRTLIKPTVFSSLTLVLIAVVACSSLPYRHIDNAWELQGMGMIDSTSFFSKDTLSFVHDDYHADNTKSSLWLDKKGNIFSLELKSRGLHGFYEIQKSQNFLILMTCSTPNDDYKSWVKQKADTFVIDKLSKSELSIHRLR